MAPNIELSRLLYPASGAEPEWAMHDSEKMALLHVLRLSQPVVSLEIGTASGGSLRHIQERSQETYSIDIDPTVREKLGPRMPKVRFLTGDSPGLVRDLLGECQRKGAPINFILVDGDHTYKGVKADLDAILEYEPPAPLWILMHDSSNPGCRRGIEGANWAGNRYVHAVELDFVVGTLNAHDNFLNQIWGGFALALLLPEARSHPFSISASSDHHFKVMYRHSIHYPSRLNNLNAWTKVKWNGLKRRLANS
jgi:hypothetical protein